MMFRLFLVSTVLLVSGCTISTAEEYDVMSVVDGDTIIVSTGKDQTERVRLIGIDTPELGSASSTPDCFAEEARAALTQYVASSTVVLYRDYSQADRDIFGRLLRYVYTEGGEHVNARLVAEGYAREFTYDEPYRFQKEYQNAEAIAQRRGVGLWATCVN